MNRVTCVYASLLVIPLLVLSGCGGSMYYFSKPGFTQQQYDQDRYECLRSAQQPMLITPTPGMPAGGMATNNEIYLACFSAKGYTVQSEEERERILEAEERAKQERLVQEREREKQLREELARRERQSLLAEKQRLEEEKARQVQVTPNREKQVYGSENTEKDVRMVLVPNGEFLYGVNNQRITLSDFYMDVFEVTTRLYAAFMQETSRGKPEHWGDVRPEVDGDKPVIGVEWSDADDYCRYYDKRLPTEQEWEKAARGTDGRTYPWGNTEPVKSLANYGGQFCLLFCNVYAEKLKPVNDYVSGRSPYGIYNMAGNAWEWVEGRKLRGGSWLSDKHTPGLGLKIWDRTGEVSGTYGKRYVLGFRCARDAH